ncbi:hypothetical protein VNO78_17094 [Psophocarpus tetragonolobus]|uniref:Uncharacterized protein n=1 Tax=Psophocarpus tetragonolobus TaxID=3891 RepID=A0AAN9SGM3_PSOTE
MVVEVTEHDESNSKSLRLTMKGVQISGIPLYLDVQLGIRRGGEACTRSSGVSHRRVRKGNSVHLRCHQVKQHLREVHHAFLQGQESAHDHDANKAQVFAQVLSPPLA